MVNQCNFIGRLGSDPKQTYTKEGTSVASFSIAVDENYKDKSGEKVKKTEWINIVSFGKLAEIINLYCHKGENIYVSGKIQTRSWEDKDGVKRYTTEIVASNMKMLDGKKASEGQEIQPQQIDGSDIPF